MRLLTNNISQKQIQTMKADYVVNKAMFYIGISKIPYHLYVSDSLKLKHKLIYCIHRKFLPPME